MMKNLALRQDVHRLGAEWRLKVKGPQQCLAVLAQQAPNGKAGHAGHKGCVNGEAHTETQQGVHGGVSVSNETAGLGQGLSQNGHDSPHAPKHKGKETLSGDSCVDGVESVLLLHG